MKTVYIIIVLYTMCLGNALAQTEAEKARMREDKRLSDATKRAYAVPENKTSGSTSSGSSTTKTGSTTTGNTNKGSYTGGGNTSGAEIMKGVFSERLAKEAAEEERARRNRAAREYSAKVDAIIEKYSGVLGKVYDDLQAQGIANKQKNYQKMRTFAVARGIGTEDAEVLFLPPSITELSNNTESTVYILDVIKNERKTEGLTNAFHAKVKTYEKVIMANKGKLLQIYRHFNSGVLQAKNQDKIIAYAKEIGMRQTTIDSLLKNELIFSPYQDFYSFGNAFYNYKDAENNPSIEKMTPQLKELSKKMTALKISKGNFYETTLNKLAVPAYLQKEIIALTKNFDGRVKLRMAMLYDNSKTQNAEEVLKATAEEMYKRQIENIVFNSYKIKKVMFDLGYDDEAYIKFNGCSADELQEPLIKVQHTWPYEPIGNKACAHMEYKKLAPYYQAIQKADEDMMKKLWATKADDLKKLVKLLKKEYGRDSREFLITNVYTMCKELNLSEEVKNYFLIFSTSWTNIGSDSYRFKLLEPYFK